MEKGFSFYVFMNTYQVRRNRGQMPHQYLGKTVVKSKDLQCTYVLCAPPMFGPSYNLDMKQGFFAPLE